MTGEPCERHGIVNCVWCDLARGSPDPAPRINGNRVIPSHVEIDCEWNMRELHDYRLSMEAFDLHEGNGLKAALEAGEHAHKLGYRLDVLHEMDVSGNDPEKWPILLHGRSDPQDVARDRRVGGIPKLGMREAAINAYLRCKNRGEPVYHFVRLDSGKEFRRLLIPVLGKDGYVVRVLSCIISQPVRSLAA